MSGNEVDDDNEVYMMLAATICMTMVSRPNIGRSTLNPEFSFSGERWIRSLLEDTPQKFHNVFRMSKSIFISLMHELSSSCGLHGTSRTTPMEILAVTLFVLGHNESVRSASNRFQHSGETISRLFAVGLQALCNLAKSEIKPRDPLFQQTPTEILNDPRYNHFFKDCIGAIDGTHVPASVPSNEVVAYIGRTGAPTQNVLAVCDFNMCFTFVMAGWEGSAHDSRILSYAMRNKQFGFPYPPRGKYYLVDAGFPMQRGFLKPFADTRYHLPDYARNHQQFRSRQELFNKRHSSLRGVIERAFGVWKGKWAILRDMPSYSIDKQVQIVVGTCALHNYI